jgi:hypothetical protein
MNALEFRTEQLLPQLGMVPLADVEEEALDAGVVARRS